MVKVCPRLAFLTAASLLVLALFAWACAQPRPTAAETGHGLGLGCSACHTCCHPTVEHPCLHGDRQGPGAGVGRAAPPSRGPELVILDELAHHFQPVRFDHRVHAQAAEATRGCAACHHHTPAGATPPPCQTCHPVAPSSVDQRIPALRDAYHRQCRSCHPQWRRSTHCTACHAYRSGEDPKAGDEIQPIPDISTE